MRIDVNVPACVGAGQCALEPLGRSRDGLERRDDRPAAVGTHQATALQFPDGGVRGLGRDRVLRREVPHGGEARALFELL